MHRFTDDQIERLKREAKQIKRRDGITHTESLDRIAREQGYQSWWHLQQSKETSNARTP